MSTTDTKLYLSTKDAADFLGVSESSIRNYCREGQLSYVRLTQRMWRIARSELERFIEAKTITAPGGDEGVPPESSTPSGAPSRKRRRTPPKKKPAKKRATAKKRPARKGGRR